MSKRIIRWVLHAILAVLAFPLLYALTAMIFALLPTAGRVQAAQAGDPPVFVCASLAHTDIVMPASGDGMAWGEIFPEAAAQLPAGAYLAFGWGDLGFYRETPHWSDLKASTAFHALAGFGPSTLHVVAVSSPQDNPRCLPLAIDREGRQALAGFILASSANGPPGRPALIAAPRAGEGFYASPQRYSLLRTCNQWAAEGLAAAGLPHARFAPFSLSVTWPLADAGRP